MISEAQKRAISKYQKKNTKIVPIRLNYKYDTDILSKLSVLDNVSGYVKNLIREDIKNG